MTSEAFSNSKYKPYAMPEPFGAGNSANYVMPGASSAAGHFNFADGFDSAFGAPKSNNGQYVTRTQMNGIGNLATRYEFFRRVGGIVTFDPDLSTAIGGYPRGAILECLSSSDIMKVISLVDNNEYDFNANGIDNVHWAVLNSEEAFGSYLIKDVSVPEIGSTVLATFRAPRTGSLRVVSTIKSVHTGSYSFTVPVGNTSFWRQDNYAILIADLGSSDAPSTLQLPTVTSSAGSMPTVNWHGNQALIGGGGYLCMSYSNGWQSIDRTPDASNLYVTKDKWYAVSLLNYLGENLTLINSTTGSDAEISVQQFTLEGTFSLMYTD